jgi:putative DNA primase/helicase
MATMPFYGTDYPSAQELTAKLGGRWNGRMHRGNCRCPAHDDASPSLDIVEKGGKLLFVCRAGCSQDAVIAALRARGAWPERREKPNGHAASPKRVVATYDYIDAEGTLRFQAIRYDPKDFRQRRPDGRGGWIWNLPLDRTHRFLPFKLPEVTEAIAQEQTILVLEGEKDVLTAAKMGIAATCNAGGAGKWMVEHGAYLKGADVVLVPDNDPAGQRHMEDVAASLVGVAKRVRQVVLPDLPPKGDLTDWIRAGGTAAQLWALVEQAPEIKQAPNRSERRIAQSEARRLVSGRLSKVAMRQIEWVWPGRIAVGMHATIAGEPGVGKSTVLYWIAATITKGGAWPCGEGTAPKGSVIILSAEDAPEFTIKPRVLAAGGDDDKVEVITATRDDSDKVSAFTLSQDLQALEALIDEIGDVVLVIIDPITSYLGDADGHSNTDIRSVVEPLHEMAARKGVAVLTNTHFAKSGAANKSRASHRVIGSTAFIALPRVALSVVQDSEDEDRRLVLHLKNNIAPAAKGLGFKLEQRLAGYIGEEPGREPVYASCVVWEEEHIAKTADEAISEHEDKLRSGTKKVRASPARDEAETFLRAYLAGGPQQAKDVQAAARNAGIQPKPLREARERIVETIQNHDGNVITGWLWKLRTTTKAGVSE